LPDLVLMLDNSALKRLQLLKAHLHSAEILVDLILKENEIEDNKYSKRKKRLTSEQLADIEAKIRSKVIF
jgi:hypothetical protein